MNQIKFIATDMDGTLLNEHKQLPQDFMAVFSQLKQKGILFAAASGRQYQSLENTFAEVKDDVIFIAENGTLVMHKGQELAATTLPKEEVHAFIRAANRVPNVHIVLCGKKSAYVETTDRQALAEIRNYYHQLTAVSDLFTVEDDFIKVAVLHFTSTEQCVYPVVAPLFAASHQVVVSGEIWLDFMHKDASKGAAIKALQAQFDFSYEQSMSFGDYLNDAEMLAETYHSYAMENAHTQIKAIARFQAPSNQQAGVLTVIRQQVL